MKKFDIWNYKVNEEDKKIVQTLIDEGIELTIDEDGKVYDEVGNYVADAEFSEGDGIGIEYQVSYQNLISLAEYAKLHGVTHDTVRQRANRGNFKTARKIGRNWVIDKNEPYIDNRKKNNTGQD